MGQSPIIYILISSRLKLDMNDKISEGITKIIEYIMSKAVKKKCTNKKIQKKVRNEKNGLSKKQDK